MIIYKCKYKNNISLQHYIKNKHNVTWWGREEETLDLKSDNNMNLLFQDNDIILFFVDKYLTYSIYNDTPYSREFESAIDYDKILRKEKLKKLIYGR